LKLLGKTIDAPVGPPFRTLRPAQLPKPHSSRAVPVEVNSLGEVHVVYTRPKKKVRTVRVTDVPMNHLYP
jgi:hypothetical protein